MRVLTEDTAERRGLCKVASNSDGGDCAACAPSCVQEKFSSTAKEAARFRTKKDHHKASLFYSPFVEIQFTVERVSCTGRKKVVQIGCDGDREQGRAAKIHSGKWNSILVWKGSLALVFHVEGSLSLVVPFFSYAEVFRLFPFFFHRLHRLCKVSVSLKRECATPRARGSMCVALLCRFAKCFSVWA